MTWSYSVDEAWQCLCDWCCRRPTYWHNLHINGHAVSLCLDCDPDMDLTDEERRFLPQSGEQESLF